MPKVHDIGKKHFVQLIEQDLLWGNKVVSKGWTQEIEEPYRFAEPKMIRLPFKRILVLGKWLGSRNEEEALNSALSRRDLTYDDFTEEAGWTPPPNQDSEEDWETLNT
jgi:hypothetical protein